MKKLLQFFCSFFKRKRNKKKEHTCEELDFPFFSLLFFFILIYLSLGISLTSEGAEIYAWSSYATLENSRGNEYVNFSSNEQLFGFGFSSNLIQKNKDKIEMRLGIGKSASRINITQSFSFMGTNYKLEKDLDYQTGMYLFSVSYNFKVLKDFNIEAKISQSKNLLKKNEYFFKLIYTF